MVSFRDARVAHGSRASALTWVKRGGEGRALWPAGHVRGRSAADCLTMGAVAAAEVISHYGARPEAKLDQLVAARLGG